MIDHFPAKDFEELFQGSSDLVVLDLHTEDSRLSWVGYGLIVHCKGNPLVLIPAEGDGPHTCIVMLQIKAFDVTGQITVHLIELVEPVQDLLVI